MFRPSVLRSLDRILVAGIACFAVGAAEEPPPPVVAPLEVSVAEAVLLALENSPELAVERLRPEVERTLEGEEQAIFDPVLVAEDLGYQHIEGQKIRGQGIVETYETKSPVGRLALESRLANGMRLGIEASTEVADESQVRQLVQSRVGLTVSQALLQGLGPKANQARVRAARLDAEISEFELRGFTESYVALVELTCWDHFLYRRHVEILDDMLAMADQQLRETVERVRIGTSARVELAAARAEVALRNQARIDARSDAEKTRVLLLRLLNPGGPDAWSREVRLKEDSAAFDGTLDDVAEEVAAALRMRPELNQARLLAKRGDLEIVRTKNGLLPRMDVFVTLGRSGYAESFSASWKNLNSNDHDVLAGLRFELPLRRSASQAQYQRAVAEKTQAEKGIDNLRLLVETDVRWARAEVERAREQVGASLELRKLDEEKLAAETEKFRIDRASAFQVARAQRDLTRSRLDEATALADLRKAFVELYRLDGSLLSRRGIAAR